MDGVEIWLEVGFCGVVVLVGCIGVHIVGVCVEIDIWRGRRQV